MRRRLGVWAVGLVLVTASCGGESADTTTTEAADEQTTQAPATTTTVQETTTSTAPATTTTRAGVSADEAIPDPSSGATLVPYADENITSGDVFIYWYRDSASGSYLALYAGPGIAGASGQALCPGNSISTPDFIHISNTPVEDGSCEGFTTDTASVQVCSGDVWIYRTLIPGDLEGTLYGSLEWNSDDGTVKGLTSQFPTDSEIGEFEFGLGSYGLWSGFTSDGSSLITCDAPMP